MRTCHSGVASGNGCQMSKPWAHRVATIVVLLATWGAGSGRLTAQAQEAGRIRESDPHVRPMTAQARDAVTRGVADSEAFRGLVTRLARSNVVVYVNQRMFQTDRWAGYLTFHASSGGRRYLVVQLPAYRPTVELVAALAHELHHAVEIAEATHVVSSETMAAHYRRIGFESAADGHCFESRGAIDAGRRVRVDLSARRGATAPERMQGGAVAE